MEVVLIRHAQARRPEVCAATGGDDAQRPLTRAGRQRMERAARGLRRLLPGLDVIAASPLRRALETAAILGAAYGVEPQIRQPLRPGHSDQVVGWLTAEPRPHRLALVGHQPDLGRLAALLLCGQAADFLPLKKGSACLIHFPAEAGVGCGALRWYLTARQLAALGRA